MDKRDKGYTLYKKGLSCTEISKKLDVSINTVKSWRKRYWTQGADAPAKRTLHPEDAPTAPDPETRPKQGAPPGNVNAVGAGAPKGNRNAVKHGGWSELMFRSWTEEHRQLLDACDEDVDAEELLINELKLLTAREGYLLERISHYSQEGAYVQTQTTSKRSRNFKRLDGDTEKEKNDLQAYVDAIDEHAITFGIGPAGTGKTYLAMAKAVVALQTRQVSRIILTRPAVEAGESLGFLPGSLTDKIDPYLRPLYDAMYDMIDPESIPKLMAAGTIEVAPLAYMRGRTLNDAFVILDEAQNTTPEQMKMFLTRLGFGSKMVVTGDVTQVDLAGGKKSGLIVVRRILRDVPGVRFIELGSGDVVRHRLVSEIIDAYERWGQRDEHDADGHRGQDGRGQGYDRGQRRGHGRRNTR